MPKKTKKQKLASERRKLQFPQKNQAQTIFVSPPSMGKKVEIISTPTIREPQKEMDSISTQIFKKDLSKSLFISGGILLLVFGIYLQQQFGILPISSLIK